MRSYLIPRVFILFFSIAFIAGITACSDDDDKGEEEVTFFLKETEVSLTVREGRTVNVLGESTVYTVSSKDSDIAEAEMNGMAVLITGKKVGETTLTVKNPANKTAEIAVTVTKGEDIWRLFKYECNVLVSDADIQKEIEDELMTDLPLPIDTHFKLTYNQTNEGSLIIYPNPSDETISMQGTFNVENDIYILKYNGHEYQYMPYTSLLKDSPAVFKSYVEVLTEYYQQKYPQVAIESVQRIQILM